MNKVSDRSVASSLLFVSAKIRPTHQERLALVYVRQSSTKQVEENIESTEMQYRLVDRAAAMGWSDDRIEVIDDDLGMSGRSVENRVGFQRMIAEVSLGHVGIIFSIEMSRLARSCRDWHQLLENCSVFGTLLADADGERVVIETVGRTEYVNVTIRWSGGFESRHRIEKPVGRFEWLESALEIRELIEKRKREGKTHAEVAEELNREGYHSTSCGAFTPAIVSSLCKKFRDQTSATVPTNKSSKWGLRELAHELGLRKETLNTWRRRGWVHATQESTRWTFWADEEELLRLRKLVDYNRQGLQKTPEEITTPNIKRT